MIIEFKNVDLGYGKSAILSKVSCSIAQGDSVGLVGQNGSGKTTFLRGVLGLLSSSRGTIEVDRSQRFAYVPQVENLNLFLALTVREVVLLVHRSKRAFGKVAAQDRENVETAMERVGISKIASLLFKECSGGQRQKTILAQALSQKPDVLLLDEPTRGLDVVAERDFLSLIQNLQTESTITILFVTHSLQIPLNFMEKILLFNEGRVIATTPHELLNTKKLEEIYGAPFLHHEFGGFRWVMPLKEPA